MTAGITLADAIAGLVAEKRAVGYKYVSEERALARFEVFCAGEFPGLETVTRASVEAWIAAARRRAVKPATLQSLAAPVRELARWFHRRGVDAYVLPAGVLEKPARYVPHIYSDRPALRLELCERSLHLVLRAGADPAAAGEHEPVSRMETEADRGQQQKAGDRRRPHAREPEAEHRDRSGAGCGRTSPRQPSVLLAACVVHATISRHENPKDEAILAPLEDAKDQVRSTARLGRRPITT